MKIFLALLFLTGIISAANPTYISLTNNVDADGNKGFRKQIENVSVENENGSDITLGVAYTFPYNVGLISEDDSRYDDITWCTNGMLRVKVYVPPHLESLQIVMQILPLNNGIGFATYVPIGEINEYEAKTKTDIGKTAFYDNLWTEHKTVSFSISNVYSIVLNDYTRSKYGVDESSNGGYLYLSFSQSTKIDASARDYDSRYQMSFSLYYDFVHPFDDAIRNDILAKIPSGLTEPVEESQTIITKECTGTKAISIVTEEGVAKSLEEICRDNNGVFVDNECYYLPADQEKYECVVQDDDIWNGERCVRDAEILCNQNSEKKWYIAGNECLEIIDEISTSADYDATQPTTLLYDKNDTAYKMAFYHANEEDWETQIKLSNNNQTATTTQKVTILNSDMSKTLLSFDVSIESKKEWSAYIYEKNSKLYLDAPLPGNNDSNVTHSLSEYVTKGVVLVEPAEAINMNSNNLDVSLKYGLNLLQPIVVLTDAQKECSENGGTWTSALGCIGATTGNSSSVYSSASYSSVGTTSVTQAQKDCSDRGGTWTNALGCIGATTPISSVARSSSSRPASSSQAASSVSLTQAQKECTDRGGSWTNALGCIGATAPASSIATQSSSSISLTQAQQECSDKGGSWTNALGCVGASTENSSAATSSEDGSVSLEKIATVIDRTTYEVSGWLARYDFINVDNELDWVFISKSRKVYQLQGDPNNGAFGWKRVYVVPESKAYAMVQIGDWDVDGDGKFDWLAVDKNSNRVYKISGVNNNGRFTFLDYRPLDIEFEFSEDEQSITFNR